MKEVGEDEDWALFWTDCSVALERCMDMKRYQVREKCIKRLSKILIHRLVIFWCSFDDTMLVNVWKLVLSLFDLADPSVHEK